MAAQGQCRIDALSIDEKPIAMAIVLQTGSRAFFWKIAYDEDFKTLSPGVQLTLELTAHQFADPTVNATDSCATANHPMINRLWPGRITIGDVLLVLPSASPSSLRSKLVVRAEEARRWIRATAKALHSRLTSLMGRTA